MGTCRAKSLIIRISLVLAVAIGILWLSLPRILERALPTVLARFGIRSESIAVLAVTPWSIQLGPFRQCYEGSESSICVSAAGARLEFAWSILERSAEAQALWLTDTVVSVLPGANKQAVGPERSTKPSLPTTLPISRIEFSRSNAKLVFDTPDRSWGVSGYLHAADADGSFALQLEQSAGLIVSSKAKWVASQREVQVKIDLKRPDLLGLPLPKSVSAVSVLAALNLEAIAQEVIEVREVQLSFSDLPGRMQLINGSGRVSVGERIAADFKLQHIGSEIMGTLRLNADSRLASGSAQYSARLGALPLAVSKLPFVEFQNQTIVSGALTLSGTHAWGANASAPTLDIDAQKLSATIGSCLASELSGVVHILPPSASKTSLEMKLFRCGIDFSALQATVGLTKEDGSMLLTLQNFKAALLNGTLHVSEAALGRKMITTPLELRGLSLREILSLHKQEYIEAEGTIDATIPIQISAQGLSVSQGKVTSQGGGWVKYQGGALAMENAALGVTQQALKEYRFTSLDAQLRYDANGQLSIAAQLRGTSPALNTDRPVHVNLELEENLLDLYKSIQIANDIEQQLQGLW